MASLKFLVKFSFNYFFLHINEYFLKRCKIFFLCSIEQCVILNSSLPAELSFQHFLCKKENKLVFEKNHQQETFQVILAFASAEPFPGRGTPFIATEFLFLSNMAVVTLLLLFCSPLLALLLLA